MEPLLRQTANCHDLYLDVKGKRPARRGSKITWQDLYGSTHDLDFVLERGGTPDVIGDPVAFIETAWRRYTKHSRNKAQEIQGAVLPLATTHHLHAPFLGVMLAGDWTDGAITQLQRLRFRVLHFSYDAIVAAFQTVGIDAAYDEETPDQECRTKIAAWEALTTKDRATLAQNLLTTNAKDVKPFMDSLENAITRQIESIRVLPLHGIAVEAATVEAAIETIEEYDESTAAARPFTRYEIQIKYNNGDSINATHANKEDSIRFLQSFLPGAYPATTEEEADET